MMKTLESQLSESLIDVIVAAFGFPTTKTYHNIFWPLFRNLTDHMAYIGVKFDQMINSDGLPAASEWVLTHFCRDIQLHGVEFIPDQGPLLVVSNHPGTYDALAIFSMLEGHNIRSVSSGIPFLELLPNARQIFLFAPRENVRERMLVFRRAIKHLQEGGTVIYFGSGHRDPDPTVYPGAERAIDNWLNVFDTFYKYVKGLKLLPMIVSGVISPEWVKHPITWLRRDQLGKQRLSIISQMIFQLRKPGKLMLSPRISIGVPISENDLRREVGSDKLHPAVINHVKKLYRESSVFFGDFYTHI